MTRRKVNWGAGCKPAVSAPEESEPPAHLGPEGWLWRNWKREEDVAAWRARKDAVIDEIYRRAANWMAVGQEVRIIPVGFMTARWAGRTGKLIRLCEAPFRDYCYVEFQPIGRQRIVRREMMPIESIEPAEG